MTELIGLRPIYRDLIFAALLSLPNCESCADEQHDWCADNQLPQRKQIFAADAITCGCGCWSRPAAELWAPTGNETSEYRLYPGDRWRCRDGCQLGTVHTDGPDSEMYTCGRVCQVNGGSDLVHGLVILPGGSGLRR